jgi:hypothetical protein
MTAWNARHHVHAGAAATAASSTIVANRTKTLEMPESELMHSATRAKTSPHQPAVLPGTIGRQDVQRRMPQGCLGTEPPR